ncbi:maker205 [Drosophila busckii]|uniref:Maker205 n=1 Tax=Drosophila busckii TaxID=30019 RepID=A0A0M4EIT5_DROBS|nr:enhancer of yellow 2b transcription factor [Drosophila busckii]ALC46658.1 maker205 [Drosophila busckii]
MATSKNTSTDLKPDSSVKLANTNKIALKDLLQKRLDDCGWSSSVEHLVRKALQEESEGNISQEQLVEQIIPLARALVPEEIHKEMMIRVREALESELPVDKD